MGKDKVNRLKTYVMKQAVMKMHTYIPICSGQSLSKIIQRKQNKTLKQRKKSHLVYHIFFDTLENLILVIKEPSVTDPLYVIENPSSCWILG